MKLKVFIFCLLVLSWFLPSLVLAAEKSTIVYLSIAPRDLLEEAIEMIDEENFIEPVIKPVILDKTNINGTEVITTVSGSVQTGIVLSIF